ncbi:zinc finger protein [Elysia marginata]|uniref:Zinc finger protein n=1 Tax=Elysia marginata TaxID=1093978 RepID=A0AAV4FYU8_9GAST|nr:zinc finger protein [Elysia marginata]
MKKAGAGVVLKATEVKTAGVKKPTEGSTMKVTDNLQSEVKDGMLQLASGKSVPVMMNGAALSDPEKTKSLRLPILRGRQKHYYDRTAKGRKFSVGEKVLVLLPTDSNKLLMQWKGPFEVVATVGVNDYRINMGGKVKTFHANLLKGYMARDQDIHQAAVDEEPPTSSSAISAATLTVIEDIEGEHFNDSDCKTLPELGGWGSNETVNHLQYGDQLTPDQQRQLEEIASSYFSIFSDRPGTVSTEEHRIELTFCISFVDLVFWIYLDYYLPVNLHNV